MSRPRFWYRRTVLCLRPMDAVSFIDMPLENDYPLFDERYRLIRRLAAGGMGEVYLAKEILRDNQERIVAIKRVLPHVAKNPIFRANFSNELKITPWLVHPNIARVYGSGEAEGMPYLVMEYVDGCTLADLFTRAVKRHQPVPIVVALQIVHDVCSGAQHAHTLSDDDGVPLGIVHRDLTPRNIIVTTDGHAKILDFGVAKTNQQSHITLPGRLKGTPSYMAPELVAGAPPSPASDVFSLGVILFELTTHRRLFRRPSILETVNAIERCEVPAPSSLVPDCPAALDLVVQTALACRPAQRYQTAEELRLALVALLRAFRKGQARHILERLVNEVSEVSDTISVDKEPDISAPAVFRDLPDR